LLKTSAGKSRPGIADAIFMNSVRQELNSLSGSSAPAIESDTNSTTVHCSWELRITAQFGSVRFLPSSDMGEAEIQAQSPLLRICTSVKTTFACHACESSCIDLAARSPSKIAWRKFLERSLAILREMGSKNGMTQAQGKLARLARLQREYEVAHSFSKESFELAKQMDSKRAAAPVLQQSAYLAKAQSQHDRAARLFGKVDALREEIGSPARPCDHAEHKNAIKHANAALGQELSAKLWADGRSAGLDQLEGKDVDVESIRLRSGNWLSAG
jgi:hypothetical protein